MIKIAIYGKGGIGKSTTISNISMALAEKGLKIMQIGCDPKADSTIKLHGGQRITTVLELLRAKGSKAALEEMVVPGSRGILCVEAGGPTPGMGCAGRGIIAAFDALEERQAFDIYQPDIVFYDVLGDVVCGGFAMPLRNGYADHVFVVTSGENMAIYAAANLAMAVKNFSDRNYARLSGVILNKRGIENEEQKVADFAQEVGSVIAGSLSFSPVVQQAEQLQKTVVEAFPDSEMADEYRKLADSVLALCKEE